MPRAFRHFYSLRRAAPTVFLLPGCPPRFRFGFCASRSACQLSRLFHFRTCSALTLNSSASCFAVMVPPDSSQARRTLSRSGLLAFATVTHPLSFVSYFRPAYFRGSVKNGPCSKHGPFSALERRGGIRRPNRCVHFPQYQFYHGKRAMGGNLIFPGSDSAK